MTGNNELVVNEATMIEAVQLWLASKFREGSCPKVQSVDGTSKGMVPSFTIKLVDEEPPT